MTMPSPFEAPLPAAGHPSSWGELYGSALPLAAVQLARRVQAPLLVIAAGSRGG